MVAIIFVVVVVDCVDIGKCVDVVDVCVDTSSCSWGSFQLRHPQLRFKLIIIFGNWSFVLLFLIFVVYWVVVVVLVVYVAVDCNAVLNRLSFLCHRFILTCWLSLQLCLFCLIVVIIVVVVVVDGVVVGVVEVCVDTCSCCHGPFQLRHPQLPFELLIIFGNWSFVLLLLIFVVYWVVVIVLVVYVAVDCKAVLNRLSFLCHRFILTCWLSLQLCLFCLIVVIIAVVVDGVVVGVVDVCVDTCSRSCRSFQLWHPKLPFELLIIFGNWSFVFLLEMRLQICLVMPDIAATEPENKIG
jgi:hypothetical protein